MYLSTDSNLIRNAGLTLYIALFNMLIYLALLLIYKIISNIKKKKKSKILESKKYRKYVYRIC
jgi:hypothetical protein